MSLNKVGEIVECEEGFKWAVRDSSKFFKEADWRDDMIGALVEGEPELKIIRELGAHYSTLVDVGCHVGYYAIRASESYEKVIAFDANPDIFEGLLINMLLNAKRVKNIAPLNMGFWSKEIEKAQIRSIGGYSSLKLLDIKTGTGVDEIDRECETYLTTMDKFFSGAELPPFVCKIDTESAELEILKGAREQIKRPSYWIIEHHTMVYDLPDRVKEIRELMESLGQRYVGETSVGRGDAKIHFTNHKEIAI